ncbi:MAG TPA: hypothetical protein VKS20_03595 [Candidatus Acidoferrales bacterium]|nr:hypothetical protein [Candidatus Acidoferrales bacterium]
MDTLTTPQLYRAIAFLKNRHRLALSREAPDGETRISVDGQPLQRGDIIRMAEAEGWSDRWKPGATDA